MTAFDLVVLGDANPDLLLSGAPRELAFGQQERLVSDGRLVLGGSGAITACGAARLGLRTALVSRVGDDAAGRFTRDELAGRGVDISAVTVDPLRPTAVTAVLLDGDDRAVLTSPGPLAALRADDVPDALLRGCRHLHVASLFLMAGLAPHLPDLLSRARRAGTGTSLDTNDDPADRWEAATDALLSRTDVLLANEREAPCLAGRRSAGVAAAARALADRVALPVVKTGAQGAMAWTPDGPLRRPAPKTAAVDAVGAGDSFDAGFLAARLAGLDLPECLELAIACGSLSTRAAGGTAAQPDWDEARAAAGRQP